MQRADMHKTSHFSTNNVHLKRYTYVVFLFLGFGIVVAFPIQTVQFTMEMQSQCVPDSGETRLHHSFLSMIFFEALSERVFVGFTEPMFPLGHWASWILHLIFKVYIYIYLYTYIHTPICTIQPLAVTLTIFFDSNKWLHGMRAKSIPYQRMKWTHHKIFGQYVFSLQTRRIYEPYPPNKKLIEAQWSQIPIPAEPANHFVSQLIDDL